MKQTRSLHNLLSAPTRRLSEGCPARMLTVESRSLEVGILNSPRCWHAAKADSMLCSCSVQPVIYKVLSSNRNSGVAAPGLCRLQCTVPCRNDYICITFDTHVGTSCKGCIQLFSWHRNQQVTALHFLLSACTYKNLPSVFFQLPNRVYCARYIVVTPIG